MVERSNPYTHAYQFHDCVRFSDREVNGARLVKHKGKRIFIDEIPADYPMTDPIVPACDFLCSAMEPAE